MSSARQRFSLVNIWAATAACLRSKGYMRSKFKSGKFANLIADSESLQKTAKRKCLSFFDIPSRTQSKLPLNVKIHKILNKRANLTRIQPLKLNYTTFQLEY